MKAAVLYEPGAPLKIEEVDLDEPGEHEILVKLVATGVCHSDLHMMKGEMPQPTPFVPGHEGAGIVEKVGPAVSGLQPGDHVILMVAISCGRCRFCVEGRPTLCVENLPIQMMGTLPGGHVRLRKDEQKLHHLFGLACFAEKTVVHERSAVKIRDDAPLETVCLLGCGASTGIGTAVRTAGIRAGESVVVFGCGGVGLSAVMGAKLAGAGSIVAVDVLDSKLEKARELGATHVVNAAREDPATRVTELLGGGADYALEFVGNVEVTAKALGTIRPGGTLVVAGMAPITSMLAIAPFEFLMGKTITGAVQGDIVAPVDIPRYVDLFMEGRLPIDKLVSHRHSLNEINDAFEAMEKGEAIRSVIML